MNIKPPMWSISPSLVQDKWSWFWNGLLSCVPVWEGSGDPYDIALLVRPELQGGFSWTVGPSGPSLLSSTALGTRIFYADSSWLPNNECTVLVICGPTTSNAFDRTVANEDNSTANTLQAIIQSTSPAWDYVWRFGNASGLAVASGTVSFADGDVHVFTAGPRGDEVFLNGTLVGSRGTSDVRVGSTTGFSWGGWRTSDNGCANRKHELFVMWDRQLSNAEITQITADPFGPIRPASRNFQWQPYVPSVKIKGGRGVR